MMYLKAFWSRIVKDFRQKQLLPLKVLFFVHASTLYVLYPYLTVHMRELGINVEETAIMSAVTPVVVIIMPPIAGMIADKIGNFKVLLSISSAIGGVVGLLLLLVPVGRVTVSYPSRAEMTLGCPAEGSSVSSMMQIDVSQYPCQPVHPYAYDVDLRIETCGFVCDWPAGNDDNSTLFLDDALSYAVKVRKPEEGTTEVFRYSLDSLDRPTSIRMTDQSTVRNFTNNLRYKTALRKVSDTSLFFPTDGMYDFECTRQNDNATTLHCVFGSNGTSDTAIISSRNTLMPFTAKVIPSHADNSSESENRTNVFLVSKLSEIIPHDKMDAIFSEIIFTDSFDDKEVSVEVLFKVKEKKSKVGTTIQLGSCSSKCYMTTPRSKLCSNTKDQLELDPSLTFWSYMAVRVFIGIVGGTAFAMFEGAVIAILREHEADYGLQKIYGSIGGMISSPLSGVLIDYASRDKGYTDFRPAFYLYAVLKILSGLLMLAINLEFKAPATNLVQDVITVLKNVEILALFVAVFVLGSAWGYIESFLFWLLQDLGASSSLMGITITVGGIAGIPLLVLSGPIINKIGHANVLFIGFIFYAIRLMGYSMIFNPWMCLIFEALEGVTTSLAFTAAVTYTARLSTTTTDTSIQGLMGGLYYGVGRGSGSLVGGYLMKLVGTRLTYRIFACIALVTGCIYFLFNKMYLLKRPQVEGNDIVKKTPKSKDIEANGKKEKQQNEKMPLKDSKTNKLYVENICKNNNYEEAICSNDFKGLKGAMASNEGKMENGLDNPVFDSNESPSNGGHSKRNVTSDHEMSRVDSNRNSSNRERY